MIEARRPGHSFYTVRGAVWTSLMRAIRSGERMMLMFALPRFPGGMTSVRMIA